ncbi:hypothetical protein [Desulfofalx alkaliphila]|uniref:hypothetical protein n=1 Tax=Desulfofalx alkaliphila TaxID=105483 RepID=UPI0004E17E8E|nr:hypothetical protein [Desulfofalx alkaliphila]
MRTWYIEDAGGGCRAFSEVLVLVSEEPQEVYSVKLPLTWNEDIGMSEMACRLMIGLMKKAGVSKSDRVLVCSGNIFHTLHQWLEKEGYNWETAKMDGIAHHSAEEAFYKQLVEAGVPANFKLEDRDYRTFYRQVEKWVKSQPDPARYWKDREARMAPAKTRYRLRNTFARPRKCHKCKGKILPYSPMVEYRLRHKGKKTRHYFHPACSPMEPYKGKLDYATVKVDGQEVEGIILPCKEESPCPVCGRPIKAGERAFYGYLGDILVFGHLPCLLGRKGSLQY